MPSSETLISEVARTRQEMRWYSKGWGTVWKASSSSSSPPSLSWSTAAPRQAMRHNWRHIGHPSENSKAFFPPVGWGLLDFMWIVFSSASSSSSSSSPLLVLLAPHCNDVSLPDLNRDHVSSAFRAGPQPRSCELSVPCRTWTAIVCVQCSVRDLNCDDVCWVLLAAPQSRSCEFSVPCRASRRSCEFSVPCRTSTAITWGDMSERVREC